MQPFTNHAGFATCISPNNIDTDQILPKQFMKKIESSGYGDCLFYNHRRDANGKLNPDFILNKPKFQKTEILICGENFGCGSARQHAVWALRDFGIKVLIAPSFAGNFYINCFNYGLLPAIVSKDNLVILQELTANKPSPSALSVDLVLQQVHIVETGATIPFATDSFYRQCLLDGLDQIDITLQSKDEILAFESMQLKKMPWISNVKDIQAFSLND